MEYRQFGRTGTRVSELCLGTMTFGNEADEATSQQIVDRFVDAGGNFIDTANVYSQGVSEEITGRAHRGQARTRSCSRPRPGSRWAATPNDVGVVAPQPAAPRARRRCAGSAPTGSTSTRCTAGTSTRRSRRRSRPSTTSSARARSATSARATSRAGIWPRRSASARCTGWAPFVCLQPRVLAHHPRHRARAHSRCAGARASPSSRGARSAAASSPASTSKGADFPAGTRGADTENPITFTYRLDDRAWTIVDAVTRGRGEDRQERRADRAQLGRCTGRGVTAPIIGARNLTQLDDNLGAVGWELDDETAKAIGWASAFRLGYPYEFIQYAG